MSKFNTGTVVAHSPEELLYLVHWDDKGVPTLNTEQELDKVIHMKLFGELPVEEKVKLFAAWCEDNECILASKNGTTWTKYSQPAWHKDSYYKIAETLPSIDWSHVSEEYSYLVMDMSGNGWLTRDKPEIVRGTPLWYLGVNDLLYTRADAFKSFKPGTIHHTKSLVKRPEGE